MDPAEQTRHYAAAMLAHVIDPGTPEHDRDPAIKYSLCVVDAIAKYTIQLLNKTDRLTLTHILREPTKPIKPETQP